MSLDKFKLTGPLIEKIVEQFLMDDFDGTASIPDCHREWWDLVCQDSKFVAIAAPRGHAKSTAITLSYALCNLLFHTSKFMVIVSDTEAQAILFLGDLKKQLLMNEDLRNLFGIEGLEKEAESDFIVKFADGFTARVMAKGSNQRLRGLKWENYRPDLIIGDDLENEEIVHNAERRDKFRRWLTGSLIPCLSKHGKLRIVGTILHMDSQLARLMPKERTKGVTVTPLSIRSPRNAVWQSALYRAHPSMNDFSTVLWPSFKPASELRAYQEHCRAEGLMDNYSAEILNDPMDPANARFSRADLLPMRDEDFNRHKYYYVGTDFATSLDKRTDYTVFVIASMADDNILMVERVIRERMTSADIIDTIINIQNNYDPQWFAFEKGSILNMLLPGIKARCNEENTYINYESFASSTDKDARASTIKARVKAHRVKFNKEADWYPAFEEELMKFPLGHDDQVDAFAILGNLINKIHRAETDKELADEEYELFKFENDFNQDGRNALTGY